MIQLNPALHALVAGDFDIYKEQPPDGLVILLPDGSRWSVSAYKQARG